MAKKKLSKEELGKIEEIQTRMGAIKAELGNLGLAELDLKNRRVNVENYLTQTQELETSTVKVLEDKYGKGSIDIEKGEFIPLEVKKAKKVVPTVS